MTTEKRASIATLHSMPSTRSRPSSRPGSRQASKRPSLVSVQIDDDDDDEVQHSAQKVRHRKISSDMPTMMTAPKHVHSSDWKDMLNLADISGRKSRKTSETSVTTGIYRDRLRASTSARTNWIEAKLKKRECAHFMPSQKFSQRCGCGMLEKDHSDEARNHPRHPTNFLILPGGAGDDETNSDDPESSTTRPNKRMRNRGPRWSIPKNTEVKPTDAYGSIVFEGQGHPSRAEYARLSFDTDPAHIATLFEKIWNLPPPKLVITIHGGLTDFDLQPKLARIFRKGIQKAAWSTDAWIITSGLNAGVVKHVAAALEDLGSGSRTRGSKAIAIGIAPWGMLKRRSRFVGKDINVSYATNQFNKSRLAELNDRHSYFLFADNGTVGRYGAEIILRKRLEQFLSQKHAGRRSDRPAVPIVCVVLEGGAFTIKVVHDYVTQIPRIPVVVCDGSGRAADLLAFTHHTTGEDGKLSESVKTQLMYLVESVFNYDRKNANRTVRQLIEAGRAKDLLTVFRLGESQRQDVDHAILTALLKGQNLTPPEQLQLALAWNRADIARTEIFTMGTEWSTHDLHEALMEALCNDRTDFVHLLLENGVSMQKFLTYGRLEQLYNTDKGPHNTLRSLIDANNKKHIKLTQVGHIMENLMGNAYKSNYTKDEFKAKYYVFSNRNNIGLTPNGKANGKAGSNGRLRSENLKDDGHEENLNTIRLNLLNSAKHSVVAMFGRHLSGGNDDDDDDSNTREESDSVDFVFRYPYSELLIWAVLTKRQEMAKLMWRHGEEALAKALVACHLYASMAQNASQNYHELEVSEEFSRNSEEFRQLSYDMLVNCCNQQRDMTIQLLTYELGNWGSETCLSLAALDGNRRFLAHPCCQHLLSDLWHGGLNMKTHANITVLAGIFMPPLIFLMEFKSNEELKWMPHTAAEQDENRWESDSSISSGEESYIESTDSDEDDEKDEQRQRTQSVRELNILSFQQMMLDKFMRKDHVSPTPGGSVLRGIVVAPNIETGRQRSRTMSIKKKRTKTKRKSNAIPTITGIEEGNEGVSRKSTRRKSSLYLSGPNETDDDLDTERETNGRLPRRTSKSRRVSRSSRMEHNNNLQNMLHMEDGSSPGQGTKPISNKRRIKEFYSAPITTFWLWLISFFLFILALSYTILVDTPRIPRWPEWYVAFYVMAWGLEVARKFIMFIMVDRKKTVLTKARVYFGNYRTGVLAIGIIVHLIGFMLRLSPDYDIRTLGRVILISNSVIWILRIIEYMMVHPGLGPYITMASEMIPRILPILTMIFVALLAFGLVRQGITYPNEEWHWILVRNIFYKPYFMLYGEVYAPEIDTCGDEVWDMHVLEPDQPWKSNVTGDTCVPGYWIAPVYMTVFMIIANVLLMNTMVACCTYVFERNVESTQEIWLFDRYRQVMEYDCTPFLPPPLTIFYHFYWLYKWLRVRNSFFSRKNLLDFSLKLFLQDDQVERVHSFEEECVEEMERQKDIMKQSSNEEKINQTAERTETIVSRMNNISSIENIIKDDVRALENRIKLIESRHKEEVDYLRSINQKLEILLRSPSSPGDGTWSGGGGGAGSGGGGGVSRTRSTPATLLEPITIVSEPQVPGTSGQHLYSPKPLRSKPSITFEVTDPTGAHTDVQIPSSWSRTPSKRYEATDDSEGELAEGSERPVLGRARPQHLYHTIADSIRLDRRTLEQTQPRRTFHYESEPFVPETDTGDDRSMVGNESDIDATDLATDIDE